MRKLSIVGGLLLSLAAVTSTMAASPSVQLAASTPHAWTTSFKDSTIHVSSTLSATGTYSSGKLVVHVSGAAKGETLTLRFFDRTGTKSVLLLQRTVKANSKGSFSATYTLNKTVLGDLKALGSKATRDLRLTAGTKIHTGVFAGK